MNPKVGSLYLLASVVLTGAALFIRPFGLVLLWPAASLLIVSGGYFGLGAKVYLKRRGKIHPLARALHGFTLLGHELSRRYYAGQCRPWDRLTPNLWIGRQLDDDEAETLINRGVTSVLDLTAEFSEPSALRRLRYRNLPILDLTAPSADQREAAAEFIDRETRQGIVYVHCKIGYSRTAAIAGGYLLRSGLAATAGEAIGRLRAARPSLVIRPEAEAAIRYPGNSPPSQGEGGMPRHPGRDGSAR